MPVGISHTCTCQNCVILVQNVLKTFIKFDIPLPWRMNLYIKKVQFSGSRKTGLTGFLQTIFDKHIVWWTCSYMLLCVSYYMHRVGTGVGGQRGLSPSPLTFFLSKFDITIISFFLLLVQDFFYKSSPPPFQFASDATIHGCTFSLTILSRPLCVTNTAVIRGLPDPTTYTYPAVLTRFHPTRVKFCRCK